MCVSGTLSPTLWCAEVDGENLAIHLILALTSENDVELLMGFMGMQETTVLTGNERLEHAYAPLTEQDIREILIASL